MSDNTTADGIVKIENRHFSTPIAYLIPEVSAEDSDATDTK